MIKFRNFTSNTVNFNGKSFPSEGLAKLNYIKNSYFLENLSFHQVVALDVVDLPNPELDTLIIVPEEIRTYSGRADLVSLGPRNKKGEYTTLLTKFGKNTILHFWQELYLRTAIKNAEWDFFLKYETFPEELASIIEYEYSNDFKFDYSNKEYSLTYKKSKSFKWNRNILQDKKILNQMIKWLNSLKLRCIK